MTAKKYNTVYMPCYTCGEGCLVHVPEGFSPPNPATVYCGPCWGLYGDDEDWLDEQDDEFDEYEDEDEF